MKPDELMAHIKALKAPSQQQQMLIVLHDNALRSKSDSKKYEILLRAELAARNALAARSKVTALLRSEEKERAAAERKARNHRLILQGVLFDLVGMSSWSRGEMLGALLELLDSAGSHEVARRAAWRQRGDALLAENGQEGE